MKAIKTNAIIQGIRSKVDGSLGLSISTPELSPVEKVAFMELQNTNVNITIEPLENPDSQKVEVEKGIEGKSYSERLRSVIYVYFKQVQSEETFEKFYSRHMESLIDQYKSKLIN